MKNSYFLNSVSNQIYLQSQEFFSENKQKNFFNLEAIFRRGLEVRNHPICFDEVARLCSEVYFYDDELNKIHTCTNLYEREYVYTFYKLFHLTILL